MAKVRKVLKGSVENATQGVQGLQMQPDKLMGVHRSATAQPARASVGRHGQPWATFERTKVVSIESKKCPSCQMPVSITMLP
jgi:hypothetical protein